VKASHLRLRHNSVAPKYKQAAENHSLYFSPSNLKLGLQDVIFNGLNSTVNNNESRQPTLLNFNNTTTNSRKPGYKNIFSNRSLAPGMIGGPPLDGIEGLTSPKGNLMRQEIYL
jgi:hypothetical protein